MDIYMQLTMPDEKEVMDWKESQKGYIRVRKRKGKGRLIYYLLKKEKL